MQYYNVAKVTAYETVRHLAGAIEKDRSDSLNQKQTDAISYTDAGIGVYLSPGEKRQE